MAKGTIAKEALMKRFITALGNDYVGTDDGKTYYFWSTENGERMQVKVTMTTAKTPLACNAQGGDINFEDEDNKTTPKEMGADEKATLDRLMQELDL